MRTRTVLTWSTGAAMGATVMYLCDPEHGATRRRSVRREALAQARGGAAAAVVAGRRQATEALRAAADGYTQARQSSPG